jgi:uncharacterized membrane protein YdfJ with MMPL/SSD domain
MTSRATRTPRAPWATKRPVLALLAAGVVTAALAAPAASLELGQPDDRNLTPDATQRQAYDRLAEGFGAGVNGPLVVASPSRTTRRSPRFRRASHPTPTSPTSASPRSTARATPR